MMAGEEIEKRAGALQIKYARLFWIAGAVIVLDQVTKLIVQHQMPLYHSIQVIGGFFSLTHIHNTGGAFGLFSDQHVILRKLLFLFMAAVATGFVLYFYHKTPGEYRWLTSGLALIFGGATGNLIDRIRMGKVVDFLDFYLGDWHWPAFNVADSAITVGVVILSFHIIFNKMPEV